MASTFVPPGCGMQLREPLHMLLSNAVTGSVPTLVNFELEVVFQSTENCQSWSWSGE